MTEATTTHAQGRPAVLIKRLVGLFVFPGMVVLVGHWVTSQLALMREYGSDPQMPIWIMFVGAKLGYWLLAGGVVAGVLFFEKPHWRILMGVVLLLAWIHGISTERSKLQTRQQALAEARDSSTSPARLEQLLQFAVTLDDYEFDNRIATNPNTPSELMRKLYGRHHRGSVMILARRPDTPEDILQAIVDHELEEPGHDLENKWIRKALKLNPNLPEAIRRKLDEHEQPVTE